MERVSVSVRWNGESIERQGDCARRVRNLRLPAKLNRSQKKWIPDHLILNCRVSRSGSARTTALQRRQQQHCVCSRMV